MAKRGITSYETVFGVSVDLFLKNGFDKTTIRMITEESGIHIGSLYYLFSNKEEILKSIIVAFYGDILCRSKRIAREYGDDTLILLLPAAFFIHSSLKSERLSRLLYQSFCVRSVIDEVIDMTRIWAVKCGIDAAESERFRLKQLFLFGGLGNFMGNSRGRPEDFRDYLEIYSSVSFGIESFESTCIATDRICDFVENEKLCFIGRPLEGIDDE